jgi:hypothetical protein
MIYFWKKSGWFLVCLTVEKNTGMPEYYRIITDYEYQGKLAEIYYPQIYILSFRFQKYIFSVNTNSENLLNISLSK